MTKDQFSDAIETLAKGFPTKPRLNDDLLDSWYADVTYLGISYTDLCQAVEVLRRELDGFPRSIKPIIQKAVQYRDTRVNDERRIKEAKQESNRDPLDREASNEYQKKLYALAKKKIPYEQFEDEFKVITGKTVDQVGRER